jgi:aspartate aminotransferase
MSRQQLLSRRLDSVRESVTLKLNALAQKLALEGRSVLNLTTGEPDFSIRESVKDAAIEAIRADRSKYTPVAGILQLREAIAQKTNRQQPQLNWSAQNVLVSAGAKHALFNALLATVNPGDQVIVPAPFWLSYTEMVKVAEGDVRILNTSLKSGYKFGAQELSALITARTKVVILNSPSNPTGAVYSSAELRSIGEVILRIPESERPWILSDEIYDEIVYSSEGFVSFLAANPELKDCVITVNGLSKSGAMTGWRVGWSVAGLEVTDAMLRLQGQSTSGINSVAQWASLAALKVSRSEFAKDLEIYRKKRDLALAILRQSGKMEVCVPEGAFYVFADVSRALGANEDASSLAERLLHEAGVAVVPGGPFGAPNAIRLSFATDEKTIQDGCQKLVEALERRTPRRA